MRLLPRSTRKYTLFPYTTLVRSAIILFLFRGELRSALVVVVTLPLAMLIAFIGMGQIGLSANLMSLAGLAIGIGMMVDGAVVMVENAFRIMAERQAHG